MFARRWAVALRVFETWLTPDDIIADAWDAVRDLRPTKTLNQLPTTSTTVDTRITGFVKYDATAADFADTNDLLSKATLNALLEDGARDIPGFPNTAVTLKPVFLKLSKSEARYHRVAAWPGPPDPARAFPSTCMSCHAYASWSKDNLPNLQDQLYAGDRYVDLESAEFDSYLRLDFAWSIQQNAQSYFRGFEGASAQWKAPRLQQARVKGPSSVLLGADLRWQGMAPSALLVPRSSHCRVQPIDHPERVHGATRRASADARLGPSAALATANSPQTIASMESGSRHIASYDMGFAVPGGQRMRGARRIP